MKRTETVGVRLSDGVKQKAGKYAKALCIPQSAFIRILVNLGLEQVEQNPTILLREISEDAFSAK
jgi:antitoxin component of RelBE/YafQ-DinJ toxin-antitoxin module